MKITGIRAGIGELAPTLLGLDPRRTDVVYRAMDRALPGHPHLESPIDMACWDLAAVAAGLPLCDLLGGRTEGRVRPLAIDESLHSLGDLLRIVESGACEIGAHPDVVALADPIAAFIA